MDISLGNAVINIKDFGHPYSQSNRQKMNSGFEYVFLRRALGQKLRLDGRTPENARTIEISLNRSMNVLSSSSSKRVPRPRSEATVTLGETKVLCVTTANITSPYADRPNEGSINFSVSIPVGLNKSLFSDVSDNREREKEVELCRLLERSLRDSEALDTESLCVIAGLKVWSIQCDVKVIDVGGGNLADAVSLAVIGSLRAFRKPEVTISRELPSTQGSSDQAKAFQTVILLHSEDEREPLPLALHHSPITVTLGIFKGIIEEGNGSATVNVLDPTLQEEAALDGTLTFSINAQKEICSIMKPGGCGLSTAEIIGRFCKTSF